MNDNQVKDYELILHEFASGKPTMLDPMEVAQQIRLLKNTLIWLMRSGIHAPSSKEPFEFIKNVLNHIERGEALKESTKKGLKL